MFHDKDNGPWHTAFKLCAKPSYLARHFSFITIIIQRQTDQKMARFPFFNQPGYRRPVR